MICRMTADIFFDREIFNHYISPGGYEVLGKNVHEVIDKSGDFMYMQFDFITYYGFIDKSDRRILHVDAQGLDIDSFPTAELLESYIRNIDRFTEFFVYTGEDDDPEIDVVSVKNVRFFCDDGEEIEVADACLDGCRYT